MERRGTYEARDVSNSRITLDRALSQACNMSRGRRAAMPDLGPLRSIPRALLDMLYGATVYEMVRDLRKERSQLEHLFILVVFGDLLGVPILPPYYTLRLLPHIAPSISCWKRSMLREKDLTDLCDQDIT